MKKNPKSPGHPNHQHDAVVLRLVWIFASRDSLGFEVVFSGRWDQQFLQFKKHILKRDPSDILQTSLRSISPDSAYHNMLRSRFILYINYLVQCIELDLHPRKHQPGPQVPNAPPRHCCSALFLHEWCQVSHGLGRSR